MDERLDSGRPRWRFLGFDGTLRVVKEGREVLVRDVAWHVEMAMLRKTERETTYVLSKRQKILCFVGYRLFGL
jgi:hypothetical protein